VSAAPHADMLAETSRLLAMAGERGLVLRVTGGVAIALHAGDVLPGSLRRPWKDIDFATLRGASRGVNELFGAGGYTADRQFNALNGHRRLLYHDPINGRQVDIFVGSFQMCHEIPLTARLELESVTIPLAELMLTKLQIVELNEKDVRDTVLLFHGHDVADHDDDAVNGAQIAKLCGSDWGLWRTITTNLVRCREHLDDYALSGEERERVSGRLAAVLDWIEAAPKTRGWKLRAKIGERKRWYELPEEVEQ
jgi:hypothetical protein